MARKRGPCKVVFLPDAEGRPQLIQEEGCHPIMMPWQEPYMEACIEALQPEGDVLEVGFGCGYAANIIQKYRPRSHTIIEYHPTVADRARQWAQGYDNVTVIEDTWQRALHKLGVFDAIFFDDTPWESAWDANQYDALESIAQSLLRKGKKLLSSLERRLFFLKHKKYRDEDLEYFFQHLEKTSATQPQHFLKFFYDLQEKGNITKKQLEWVLLRLQQEALITKKEIQEFFGKLHKVDFRAFKEPELDRFFEFLQICLKEHMREGSRCSYSVDAPTSKFEEERFFQEIILNPHVDFQERRIPLQVPKECHHYPYDEALVVLITKR
ncbi:MAG: hypothetical protein FJZ63_04820 [Chlamydiae bacterium]|nr:hypothetical protein [Chlamydiota bacterium]